MAATDKAAGTSDRTARHLEQALALHQQGQLGAAERLYQEILAQDRRQFDALHYLAAIRLQQGRADEAAALMREAVAVNPDAAEAHAGLASALQAARQPDAAIASLERALALKPDYAEAHYTLACLRQALRRDDAAVAGFTAALALDPDFAEAAYGLGRSLQALDRHAEAATQYESALAVDPDYGEARFGLGSACAALGRHAEAAEHFARAAAIDPANAQPHLALGASLQVLNRHAEAVAAYETALVQAPELADAHNNLAASLIALTRFADAMAPLERALALRPDYLQAHSNLGHVLLALGRDEEAADHYQQALALAPGAGRLEKGLGRALVGLDRHTEAIAHYEKAIALDDGDYEAHGWLGNALVQIGRLSEAAASLEKAVALAPHKAVLYYDLVQTRRLAADDPWLAAMEACAGDMESLLPNDRIALHFALGKAYADIGQHERSFRHLDEGNALKRRTLTYDEAGVLGGFDRIRAATSSALFRARQGCGDPSAVPVFIVGMPRSGTTLVEQVLAAHPSVFGAGELKAFHHALTLCPGDGVTGEFPEAIATMTGEQFRRLGARYLAEVTPLAPAAARITDKMPDNFRFVGIIHLALPNARIIHLRRNPVDTCFSCFSILFGNDPPHAYDLAELGRYYRGYRALMAHWRAVLPAGVMLEVDYEALVDNFEANARRVVAHCGLEWNDACLDFHKLDRPVRTASVVQVRQPVGRGAVRRWLPYRAMLGPLIEALGEEPDAPS
ncbi:MAG TPA: tetratricopeptide repeat protein [Stellaceae bacterium]|nr:tetratricopeptide repeat protein [Stellaceae bacterium]